MTLLTVIGSFLALLVIIAPSIVKYFDLDRQQKEQAEKERLETFNKNREKEKEREQELSNLNKKIRESED